MSKVGERIREIRDEQKLTQDQLATRAGLSKGFLSDVETGKRNISSAYLLQIANALGASIDYLLRGAAEGREHRREPITIPPELSSAAEELKLSYAEAIELLEAHRSVIARRSARQSKSFAKKDWIDLYKAIQKVFG